MTLQPLATKYTNAGLSVIPIKCDGSKRPALKEWTAYQQRIANQRELDEWFRTNAGISIITGDVSGGLEVIDFDEPALYSPWCDAVREAGGTELLNRLPIIETPSGGRHVYYRCPGGIAGNTKLARRPLAKGWKTLIETRGEGGYVLAPGSAPECHPSHKQYSVLDGALTEIPVISQDERQILIITAQNFDEVPVPVVPDIIGTGTSTKPGEDFASKVSWQSILEGAGWTLESVEGDKQNWRRPGKDEKGHSATVNYKGADLLYVFSSNAYPFEANTSYGKFAAYAWLHHGGNYKDAAKALSKQGYGKPAPKEPAPVVSIVRTSTEGMEDLFIDQCTDNGNAHRFIRDWSHLVCYDKSFGWGFWNGKHWELDQEHRIMQLAKKTAQNMKGEIANLPHEDRVPFAKWARQTQMQSKLSAMISLAEDDPRIKRDINDFDPDPLLLNAENGVINLETGELLPHHPKYMCSRIIPVAYDPYAKCPVWDEFCEQTFGSHDLITYMQRVAGYTLSGLNCEQAFWILKGEGNNGKSIYRSTLFEILGGATNAGYARVTSAQTFISRDGKSVPNDLAALRGARMIMVRELPRRAVLDDGLCKDWTDGVEPIDARFLNKEFFSFRPASKLFFTTNFPPKVMTVDKGFWRRPKIVPFNRQLEDADIDRHFMDKVRAEYPGILSKFVREFMVYRAVNNLLTPDEVLEEVRKCKGAVDPLHDFLDQKCVEHGEERAQTLYEAFRTFAQSNGEERIMSAKMFAQMLDERNIKKRRTSLGIYYTGISLQLGE